MSASTHGPTAKVLEELRQKLLRVEAAAAWLPLGDAIAHLEEMGPQSNDGRPWTEVVKEFHEGLGVGSLSVGHLQKVRRVRNFVRKVLDAAGVPFSDDEIAAAQVSALEVADRLYSLDAERGQAALLACIRDRKKFVDMRREYEDFVQQHPERLPQKRATWLKKRQSSVADTDDAALVEKVIMATPDLFLGAPSAVLKPFDPGRLFPFLKATNFGFRIISATGERTLGVAMATDRTLEKKFQAIFFAQLEFQSSFFDSYWLFTNAKGPTVEKFGAAMAEFRIDQVGLLRLHEDGRGEVIGRPNPRPPALDRRDLLKRE